MLTRMEKLREDGVTDEMIAKAEAIFDATHPWRHTSAQSPFRLWSDKTQDYFLKLVRWRS